eukprot:4027723-Amphidinium_carterae.1
MLPAHSWFQGGFVSVRPWFVDTEGEGLEVSGTLKYKPQYADSCIVPSPNCDLHHAMARENMLCLGTTDDECKSRGCFWSAPEAGIERVLPVCQRPWCLTRHVYRE